MKKKLVTWICSLAVIVTSITFGGGVQCFAATNPTTACRAEYRSGYASISHSNYTELEAVFKASVYSSNTGRRLQTYGVRASSYGESSRSETASCSLDNSKYYQSGYAYVKWNGNIVNQARQ